MLRMDYAKLLANVNKSHLKYNKYGYSDRFHHKHEYNYKKYGNNVTKTLKYTP